MKCPYCDYIVGGHYVGKEWVHISPAQSERGDFWEHPVQMQRKRVDSYYT